MMVSPDMSDLREKCGGCSRNILTHDRISTCELCSKLVHAKCASQYLAYSSINNSWTCKKCILSQPTRYNPFRAHKNSSNKAGTEPDCEDNDIHDISQILNSCSSYSAEKFNNIFTNSSSEMNLPVLFNNIDGCASNFDSLCCELSQFKNEFSIVSLAETNIDEEHGPLYQMSGYQSVFQSKIVDKQKGSGLAIYVRECLEYCSAPEFNHCTKNMESLFIKIKNTKEILTTVGKYFYPRFIEWELEEVPGSYKLF